MTVEYIYPSQDNRLGIPNVYKAPAQLAESGDLSFWDVLDVINPLQQLPVIGSIYRAVTGDTISPAAQIAGGTLFGGPLGFALSALGVGLSGGASGGIGDQVLALFDSGTPTHQYAASQYEKMVWLS